MSLFFLFTLQIISDTNCSVDESEEKSLRHLDSTLQYINVSNDDTHSTNSILAAVRNDLECFKDLQSLLLELPEEMCGVNPHHLAYMRDKECWNGTDRGRQADIAHPIIITPYTIDNIYYMNYISYMYLISLYHLCMVGYQ